MSYYVYFLGSHHKELDSRLRGNDKYLIAF